MKKRRVLALLLALSLAVSMNGMTVLAEGTGESGAVVLSQEGQNTQDDSENEGLAGDLNEGGNSDTAESGSDGRNDTGETGEGSTDGESEGKNGNSTGTEETTGNDPETGDETGDTSEDEDKTDEETGEGELGEEVQDEEQLPLEEETEISEEEELDEEKEEEKEETENEPVIIRMVTFTDDTGMAVTYNAAAGYNVDVDQSGVLNGITNSDGSAVSGVVSLPADKSITAIGAAFQGNTNITYVKLPSGVTSIKEDAFKNCTSLKGIYLSSSVTEIGKSAFEGCTRLTQIAIPKAVESIGDKAFYGDSKLFMVYMKDADYSSLHTIGASAFYGCTALDEFCSDTSFVIPGNLEVIGEKAFYNCKSISAIDFNESVTTVGAGAFQNCTGLKSVSLSSKLETIPQYAFAGCNNLVGVTFKAGNKTIDEYAFSGCYNLGGIELSYSVETIGRYAFQNCTRLVTAEIPNGNVTIGDGAFPNVSTLTLIGMVGSKVYDYTLDKNIKFVSYKDYNDSYYTYSIQVLGDGQGTLTVKDKDGKDPNTLAHKDSTEKGVTYGTKLYVYYTQGSGSKLIADSVKCNGTPLSKDSSGKYYFTMPIGGALITAEFQNTASSTNTAGLKNDISIEVSNGEVTTNDQDEINGVELKIGQYSRMFLIDAKDENKTVDTAKITFKSSNTKVATVTSAGMIHAVKAGTAKITATLKGGDGNSITKEIRVTVTSSDIASLKVKATSYDASLIKLTQSAVDEVQTATVDKNAMSKALTFKLKATAYDALDDDMSVALKWATSDAKVAKLGSTSTTEASPVNTVTIPVNVSGEATITVTATKADKTTVTQNFIVSVKDYTPRLVSSSLTVNPNQEDGVILEIVNAYANTVDMNTVQLEYSDKSTETSDFKLKRLTEESDENVSRFRVIPEDGLGNKTYSLNVNINNGTYSIPLKVTVKSSAPSPKVAFAKNQKKINLFEKKDGTEVVVNVTNLGSAKVAEDNGYTLEALSTSDDDKLFTENFEVSYVSGSSCVITQKSDKLLYTSKNKPAVTGYLVLRYDGYKDSIVKKFKITIPTQTVTPSYVLDKTSGTFNSGCTNQTITVALKDKKNKNQLVNLYENGYHVELGTDVPETVKDPEITTDGKISFTMTRATACKVKLVLTNDAWADNKSFTYTYTIKTSSSAPTISLGSSSVTLNSRYQEKTESFTLKSNQSDTVVTSEQEFQANVNSKTKYQTRLEYEKLDVTYKNGVGTVSINDPSIANGTYSFVCTTKYDFKNYTGESALSANKITLKVKIVNTAPTVTIKGSIALNTKAADENDNYVEKSVVTFTTKNLPEGYVIDADATKDKIVCTTKNYTQYADCFDWNIEAREISVSLNQWCPNKTYSFNVTPVFVNNISSQDDAGSGTENTLSNSVSAKTIKINVKVYSGDISVSLSGKGKLNLVDRTGECTSNNSIVYTPSFKNLKDSVEEASVYDVIGNIRPKYSDNEDDYSDFFDIKVASGKLYVYPKEGAQLENNKTYKVMVWMKLKDYQAFDSSNGNGTWSKVLSIKTAQTLPKVTTDKSTVNLYLSNKNYEATFVVDKQLVKSVKPVGELNGIGFGEKDTKANGSFTVTSEQLSDGSLKVKVKLKDTVSYGCNSTNKIKMYVTYEGQGTNTTGTAITMNVKINK